MVFDNGSHEDDNHVALSSCGSDFNKCSHSGLRHLHIKSTA